MKVIILAGGFGTRLAEYTQILPKPMVKIGNKPIIWHIMKKYSSFGFKDFYIALGNKSEIIKDYFLNYYNLNCDFTVDLANGKSKIQQSESLDWRVTLVDTGLNTMTGGRLKRLKKYLGEEDFMVTYGDGLADINIKNLLDFHNNHKKLVTITAVRPIARFGELTITKNKVTNFQEKPQVKESWINGGFFVMNYKFLDLIDSDSTVLEQDPLTKAAEIGELMAFEHNGFWQCMDNKRDKDYLESLWEKGDIKWEKNQ